MLSELGIRNFKGISNGELNKLGQINVFVGPNNSGKSTILDSVYLLNHLFKPFDTLGNHIPKYISSKKAGNNNLQSLNYKYREDLESIFSPVTQKRTDHKPIDLIYNNLNWRFTEELGIKEEISGENKVTRKYIGTKYGSPYDSLDEMIDGESNKHLDEIFQELKDSIHPTLYMHSGTFQVLEQIEKKVWSGLYHERKDKKVIRMLNDIYNTNVDQLSFVPTGGDSGNELRVLFEDYSAQPGTLGDGFRYAFALFSAIESFDPSVVLIEEPENHQHPSAYIGIAESVVEYAQNKDIQFFITTHSLNFLTYLSDLSEDMDLNIFHLNLGDGNLNVREIDEPDLSVLEDLGIDPRRLDEYGG